MNEQTRISGKGQIVIPKGVRDRFGWTPGTPLEIVETGDAITLRPVRGAGRVSVADTLARLRTLYRHAGPAVPVGSLGWSADVEDEPS